MNSHLARKIPQGERLRHSCRGGGGGGDRGTVVGLSLPSLQNSILSDSSCRKADFLEAAVGELMSHVNKVNLVPGHFELGAPPSLSCCLCWIHWSS